MDTHMVHGRWRTLLQLRAEALQRLLAGHANRHESDPSSPFQVGDTVIVELNDTQVQKLLQYYGNRKLMPIWSEPMRLTKCLNQDNTVFQAESLWHRDLVRQVTGHMCKKIPTVLLPELSKYREMERTHDHTVHRAPPSHKPSTDSQFPPTLKRVPEEKHSSPSSTTEEHHSGTIAESDDDTGLWTYNEPLPQTRKRKRIFCVRLRTRSPSKEGRG
eukprot:Blabericola_migrator_1__2038@NODE_1556_length_4278_cov_20_573261_g1020_i0_p3_GENE_NODE_1556_length_4278_cov_20_573261_g1020_i0NODE_1556_length_4278_cov_20_573261_g1020_i0_p3_ORF_typecomplete_len216_score10_80_NODE_1556_length_4278_cov_20_573261_g1020_i025453192